MIELRSQSRYMRRLELTVTVQGQEHPCVTRDVSLGGLFAEAPVDVPVGTALEVRFRVGTLRDEVRSAAVVRWVQRDGASVLGLWIKLDGLGAFQQWGLNRFFAQEPPAGGSAASPS